MTSPMSVWALGESLGESNSEWESIPNRARAAGASFQPGRFPGLRKPAPSRAQMSRPLGRVSPLTAGDRNRADGDNVRRRSDRMGRGKKPRQVSPSHLLAIQCERHGVTAYCLVCRHLREGNGLGYWAIRSEPEEPAQAW